MIYLGEFWTGFGGRAVGIAVLALLLGTLASVNYRGVGHGSRVSSVIAAAKLTGLGLFVIVGLVWMAGHGAVDAPPAPPGTGPWLEALLILVFAYGGFEAALMPLAEAKDPEHDAPVALFTALAASAVIYTLVQVGQQPCVGESADVDAQGNLSLSADKSTLVRVYNCA